MTTGLDFAIDKFFPEDAHENGDGAASFDVRRPLYLEACRNYLDHYGAEIRSLHRQGGSGQEVVAALTAMIDTLVRKLYRNVSRDLALTAKRRDMVALVAIGGYGRGELNPHSDIDLMFLYGGNDQQWVEDIAQKVLYFLWDMKLQVGYSVRTVSDCLEMAKSDLTVKTSLLDARFLIGSRILYREFAKVQLGQMLARGSDPFIRDKLEEQRKRRSKYGASVYLLEPNLKEGEGGLRDLHTALWVLKVKYKVTDLKELILKGVVSEEELARFDELLDYLWRIRNELHFLAGRKNDQITFEAQRQLAEFLGYRDSERGLAVEEFMRDYYLHANTVEHTAAMLIARCVRREEGLRILGYLTRRPVGDGFFVLRGELVVPDEGIILRNPVLLMKLFEYAQKHGVQLNIKVKALVRNSLELVNDKFRRNREVNQSFMNILASDKGVAETLRLMHHLQFLNRYIPEFERIYCKVQHDLYHIYTVDIHSLFAIEELEKLASGQLAEQQPLLTRLARDLDNRPLLMLAVLFHDIGKGEGGGHAEKGAAMVRTIGRRMGLGKEEGELLEFLVRSHLLMAHIAQRRDLHDDRLILDFSRQMQKGENLAYLYLLTYADICAVGPDVWTEWKSRLLQLLYEKAAGVLERGDFRLEEKSERVKKIKKRVRELLADELPVPQVKEELKGMTARQLLANSPAELAAHVRLLVQLSSDEPLVTAVRHEESSGFSTLTICTFDMPGLFVKICGVMAANGLNILGAQINTSSNGKVVDQLQVNSPQGFAVTDPARWQRVADDLRQVLSGTVQVDALVAKRRRATLLGEKSAHRFPTRIEIDNEVSADYTVIDIYTHDQVGLLYRITNALAAFGLYIGVAKISTKVDQVADAFYVKDIFGHKVIDEAKLADLRERLLHAIG